MLEKFAQYITVNLLNIEEGTHLYGAVSFFIYDIIKISILLLAIIFVVSFLRTYLQPARVRKILAGKRGITGHVLAALIGIVTPFCTCSAIPLFLGFLEAGVPLGVTFSFLVASPMINEVAIVLLFGMFGIKITAIYILSGLLIAIISGLIIGGLNAENLVNQLNNVRELKEGHPNLKQRLLYSKKYTWNIYKKILPYLAIGIAAGGFMHGYVPADFLAKYIGEAWYGVPLATIVGIPLYSNAAGTIPLVAVLTEKGVNIGTALAFMMAVTGLSLPEFMILKRVMKPKLILIFAGIVGAGIILTGYLFNFLLK
jgi:uncharacterized protein